MAVSRRDVVATCLMAVGVVAGYATGAFEFLRYLVPLGSAIRYREMFVGPADALGVGDSRVVTSPTGESFVMARTSDGFRVLSDTCPHLGCKVHWDGQAKHFLCPCHMGVFDAAGKAISGPPAEANQNLTAMTTIVRGKSVFVMIKES